MQGGAGRGGAGGADKPADAEYDGDRARARGGRRPRENSRRVRLRHFHRGGRPHRRGRFAHGDRHRGRRHRDPLPRARPASPPFEESGLPPLGRREERKHGPLGQGRRGGREGGEDGAVGTQGRARRAPGAWRPLRRCRALRGPRLSGERHRELARLHAPRVPRPRGPARGPAALHQRQGYAVQRAPSGVLPRLRRRHRRLGRVRGRGHVRGRHLRTVLQDQRRRPAAPDPARGPRPHARHAHLRRLRRGLQSGRGARRDRVGRPQGAARPQLRRPLRRGRDAPLRQLRARAEAVDPPRSLRQVHPRLLLLPRLRARPVSRSPPLLSGTATSQVKRRTGPSTKRTATRTGRRSPSPPTSRPSTTSTPTTGRTTARGTRRCRTPSWPKSACTRGPGL